MMTQNWGNGNLTEEQIAALQASSQEAAFNRASAVSKQQYNSEVHRWKFCAYDGVKLQSDWKHCPHCGITIPFHVTAAGGPAQFLTGMAGTLGGGLSANPLSGMGQSNLGGTAAQNR